jgi:hypothetical protein
MFQSLDSFFKSWEYEANATQRLLKNLTVFYLKGGIIYGYKKTYR